MRSSSATSALRDDDAIREAEGALAEGNPKRALATCLGALGSPPRAIAGPTGPGWVGHVRGAWVFAAFDRLTAAVLLEVPVARVPPDLLVPALRRCLELSSFDGFRLCLRGDLVVDRFASRAPADARGIFELVGDLVLHAEGARRRFVSELGATPPPRAGEADPDGALFGFTDEAPQDFEPETLRTDVASSRRSVPTGDDDLPPILAMAGPPSAAAAPEPDDDLPPILAAAPARAAEAPKPPRPPEASVSSLEIRAPTPPRGTMRSDLVAAANQRDRLLEMLDATRALALVAATGTPGSALVELVVRATTYRAVHELATTFPAAVATLVASTPEHVSTDGSASGQAEAAMLIVERLLDTPERWADSVPLRVPALRSSAEVREHLRRYARLIEAAPADVGLRFHLLLGALSELLGRTKLPDQTQARLRDIVSFARKEGSRPRAIELMMTALSRIIA